MWDDFDDTLLGTECSDGDPTTFDDIYIDCDVCQGFTVLGIEDNEKVLFSLYPNPSSGLITLNLVSGLSGNCEVYDLRGQLIFKSIISERTINIDLSSFPASMYIVKVSSEDGSMIAHEKVLIE